MADTKISALTSITGSSVDTSADLLPIVDTSASATKKITVDEVRNALGPILGTEQASTSGTSIDFTSIPSWATEIAILFNAVSTSGTSNLLLQIGDSGGVETTGYLSCVGDSANAGTSTAGFILSYSVTAASVWSGRVVLSLENAASFRWVAGVTLGRTDVANFMSGGGAKALSAALDRVRITTANGTDTFDAGTINILYG